MKGRLPQSRPARVALLIGAVLLGVNLIAAGIDAVAPSPTGPASSSFATKPRGLAAWAELARRSGRTVRAQREPPSARTLPSGGTVVLLDPQSVPPEEVRAVRAFAERGGRVVAGGRNPELFLGRLLGSERVPRWDDKSPKTLRPNGRTAVTGGARSIRTAGEGRWRSNARAVPGDSGPGILVSRAGSGEIVLLADASPLQNRLLGESDNAVLALALAGPGELTFLENVHGYGPAKGLAALPARFTLALIGLALAALALMLARGRRLGPPELERRELPPPRRAYMDSLAATLARGKRREAAVAPVREAARERVARRVGLAGGAGDEQWVAAGLAAGLDEQAARALTGTADDDETVMATGRALAQLSGRGQR